VGWKNVVSVVAVAQLVESRIVIPAVVGSSPIGHPTTSGYVLDRWLTERNDPMVNIFGPKGLPEPEAEV
jgi:hypothetical protein